MRSREALLVAQSCVEVAVNRLDNLSAVQFARQQSAAVSSPQPEAANGAKHKREHEQCVHAVGLNPYM